MSPSELSVPRLRRRRFLEILGIGAMAAVASRVLPSPALAKHFRRRTRPAFRLSTHGRRACIACKGHAANRYFRTREAAAQRAHPGCNCGLVTQQIPEGQWHQYFTPDRDVWDVRWEPSRRSG